MSSKVATLWLDKKSFAVWIMYCVLVCLLVSSYQPWEDEGRAWLLARSFGLYQLVFQMLRYESHPALWYLLLWEPAHQHVPFVYINWFSAAIASSGIYCLLRFSPFPFFLRALLPFGFSLAYEYAVVARSYVLFPLLGFLAVHFFRKHPARPIPTATFLALLANVSLHGSIVAIGFAIAYVRKWMSAKSGTAEQQGKHRDLWIGGSVFVGSLLFAAICVRPAPGLNPVLSPTVKSVFRHFVPARTKPGAPPPARRGWLDQPKADTAPAHTVEIAFSAPPPSVAPRQASYAHRLWIRLRDNLGYPVASFYPLALLYEGLVLVYLFKRRKLVLILPAFLLCTFLVTVYSALYHLGLMWVTFVLVLWAAWDEAEILGAFTFQKAVGILLAILCVLQLPWTVGALIYQRTHSTYPAEATANYLKQLPPGTRIYGKDLTFTVLPYFPANIFSNYHPGQNDAQHELWPRVADLTQMVTEKPDVIVLREPLPVPDQDALSAGHYLRTHTFCGGRYFPNQLHEPLCFGVYEKQKTTS